MWSHDCRISGYDDSVLHTSWTSPSKSLSRAWYLNPGDYDWAKENLDGYCISRIIHTTNAYRQARAIARRDRKINYTSNCSSNRGRNGMSLAYAFL